ncbi:MAG: hypothetical protein BLM47_04375 [Candidatus Reconcilbacillus cellulovorans]|uniref:Uncharacterized protein n=1 Tax=Candidatus Reconcilbacillus cellulovorans TaxID=1906605 RepID=A0A2A6E2L7_9BACL|nr:MAG: hypothetical protein BLM47_04375 [Candidatus Reconcilbacillus cellulovorans]
MRKREKNEENINLLREVIHDGVSLRACRGKTADVPDAAIERRATGVSVPKQDDFGPFVPTEGLVAGQP